MHATAPRSTPDTAGFSAYLLRPDARIVCLRSQLPLISEDAPVRWVHVAYEGEWRGYRDGPIRFTREGFEQAVRNFERQRNAAKLDFDHETDYAPPGTSVPARGWVHKLEVRDEGGIAHLYALTEFGGEAVRKNREGGYRFCSGVFDFDAIDRVTGEPIGLVMPRLALTDDPFVDGQKPILLTRRAALADREVTMKISKDALIAQLQEMEGDELTPEQIAMVGEALGLLQAAGAPEEPAKEPAEMAADNADDEDEEEDKPAAMSAALASDAPAEEEPAAAMANGDLGALLATFMEQHGVSAEEILAALQPAQDPAAEAVLSRRQGETIAALNTRLAAAEKQLRAYAEREADEAVNALVSGGRILDTGRAEMRALYLSNRKAFDAVTGALPKVVPMGAHASAHEPPTQETPAINEDDEGIKSLRVMLGQAGIKGAKQDEAVRKHLAARRGDATRV